MTEHHIKSFVTWSQKAFPEATPLSSLSKLHDEVFELLETLAVNNKDAMAEEYVDCIMCLLDSAARTGITPEQLTHAFAKKLYKNVARKWVKNDDNTYSHVK